MDCGPWTSDYGPWTVTHGPCMCQGTQGPGPNPPQARAKWAEAASGLASGTPHPRPTPCDSGPTKPGRTKPAMLRIMGVLFNE